jgi:hypothetical protein
MPVLLAKSPLRTDQPGPKSTGPLGSSGFYGPVQLYDIKGAHRMDLMQQLPRHFIHSGKR